MPPRIPPAALRSLQRLLKVALPVPSSIRTAPFHEMQRQLPIEFGMDPLLADSRASLSDEGREVFGGGPPRWARWYDENLERDLETGQGRLFPETTEKAVLFEEGARSEGRDLLGAAAGNFRVPPRPMQEADYVEQRSLFGEPDYIWDRPFRPETEGSERPDTVVEAMAVEQGRPAQWVLDQAYKEGDEVARTDLEVHGPRALEVDAALEEAERKLKRLEELRDPLNEEKYRGPTGGFQGLPWDPVFDEVIERYPQVLTRWEPREGYSNMGAALHQSRYSPYLQLDPAARVDVNLENDISTGQQQLFTPQTEKYLIQSQRDHDLSRTVLEALLAELQPGPRSNVLETRLPVQRRLFPRRVDVDRYQVGSHYLPEENQSEPLFNTRSFLLFDEGPLPRKLERLLRREAEGDYPPHGRYGWADELEAEKERADPALRWMLKPEPPGWDDDLPF